MSSSCDERREYQKHTPYLPDRIGADGNCISGIGYHRYGLDSDERYTPTTYSYISKEERKEFREKSNALIDTIDEYFRMGNSLTDGKKLNAFIREKEIGMARKKETTTAIMDMQGLNAGQIAVVTQKTPKHLVRRRKGRGGKVFDYLPHAEVAKILNEAFNHAWSFQTEPILQFCNENEVTVKGILIIHGQNGQTIIKEQYGNQDLLKNRQGQIVMSYGDAMKGAASDALKKCASLLGIALDLYANGHQYIDDPKPEPVIVTPKEPPKAEPEPDKMTDKQKDFIRKLIKSHVFSTDERDKAISFCDNPDSTKEKAGKFIDSLQSHIKSRKDAEKSGNEKDALLQKVMVFRDADPENFDTAMADFKAAYNTRSATTIEHLTHILAFRNGNGNQHRKAA